MAPTRSRVRSWSIALIVGAIAGLAVAPSASAATCPGADVVQTPANVAQARAAMFCLLNAERRARGQRPLVLESHLQTCAQRHDDDMIRRRYFSHHTLGGPRMIARLMRCGYRRPGRPTEFGEALGWNSGAATTPRRMLAQILVSPLHRGWLLGARFTHVGIGVMASRPWGGSGVTYCIVVGRRG